MGNPIKGSDLMLFVKSGATYKSVAFATSHTLSVNVETTEISTKDNGGKWAASASQKMSWTMSTDNLFALDGDGMSCDNLWDIMTLGQPVDVVFALESAYASAPDSVPTGGWTPIASPKWAGKAIITSMEINAPNGDNATFSATLTGVGALVRTATA